MIRRQANTNFAMGSDNDGEGIKKKNRNDLIPAAWKKPSGAHAGKSRQRWTQTRAGYGAGSMMLSGSRSIGKGRAVYHRTSGRDQKRLAGMPELVITDREICQISDMITYQGKEYYICRIVTGCSFDVVVTGYRRTGCRWRLCRMYILISGTELIIPETRNGMYRAEDMLQMRQGGTSMTLSGDIAFTGGEFRIQ